MFGEYIENENIQNCKFQVILFMVNFIFFVLNVSFHYEKVLNFFSKLSKKQKQNILKPFNCKK